MKLLATFLSFYCISFCSSLIPNQNHSTWTVIQEHDVWVGYDYFEGTPICRAIGILELNFKLKIFKEIIYR